MSVILRENEIKSIVIGEEICENLSVNLRCKGQIRSELYKPPEK